MEQDPRRGMTRGGPRYGNTGQPAAAAAAAAPAAAAAAPPEINNRRTEFLNLWKRNCQRRGVNYMTAALPPQTPERLEQLRRNNPAPPPGDPTGGRRKSHGRSHRRSHKTHKKSRRHRR